VIEGFPYTNQDEGGIGPRSQPQLGSDYSGRQWYGVLHMFGYHQRVKIPPMEIPYESSLDYFDFHHKGL
jgi:hypothetical protein